MIYATHCLMLIVSLFAAALTVATADPGRTDPRAAGLMPMPAKIRFGEGAMPIRESLSVAFTGYREVRLDRAVRRFAENVYALTGVPMRAVFVDAADTATLVIQCDGAGQSVQSHTEDESYTLRVAAKQVTVAAKTPVGVMRGLATLAQLVQPGGDGFVVPQVHIDDRPRFVWRGLLIDPCRHWMPMKVIKRNLDGMAAVKLNVLHFHLTEDQGFRVESKRYPRLHEFGSDGLYFTQDELREIVAYARDRGIRVVPEFDVPGHTMAWLVGHPELAAGPDPIEIGRRWGGFVPCMDPTNEKVYELLDGFFEEMAGIFPDAFMHIGGDEVDPTQWNKNPEIQAFMRANNLADSHALQAHFNQRIAAILAKHDRKVIGWDEILHPDLPTEYVIQSWRGIESLRAAAEKGYGALLSNGYYLDHQRSAAFHYANDPGEALKGLRPEQQARVLGGEACMWAEYVSPETVDSRIWPRLAVIAERLWSPADVRDEADMYARHNNVSHQLDLMGLRHRSNYEPMLRRLVGRGDGASSEDNIEFNADVQALRVLADVVEPVKFYQRSAAGGYTSFTPLNRLVDAARPESDTARHFRNAVDAFLQSPTESNLQYQPIHAVLQTWQKNHDRLLPVIRRSPLLREIDPVSRNLRDAAEVGLAALDLIAHGEAASPEWRQQADATLNTAGKNPAEVVLANLPGIRALVDAARDGR